jgi:glutaredoxin
LLLSVIAPNSLWAQTVNTTGMSYELRRAVENFPVTLYTSNSCGPCDAGRTLLTTRGVPFIEKTINTQEDIAALKSRQLGDQVPVLSVGSRSVKGYEAEQWDAALNFGNYPKTSQLARRYRNPEPTPLVAATPKVAPTPVVTVPSTPAPMVRPAPTQSADNPAGIRF